MAIATPAPCLPLQQKIGRLQQELEGLNETGDPNGPFRKPDPVTLAERRSLVREISSVNGQLTSCIVKHTGTNVPMTVTFESIFCGDQNDTQVLFIPEADEPYLIVYALNLPTTIPTNLSPSNFLPDARAFKIGTMHGVDSGESVSRPTDVWDTNGRAQVIADPNRVVILVALLEEDDSGADYVRTAVQTGMPVVIATNLPALFTDPEGFRARLLEGMRGVIATALNLFPLPPESADDLIGAVQQIRLTRTMLNNAIVRGSVPIPLNFATSDTRYSASFRLRRV